MLSTNPQRIVKIKIQLKPELFFQDIWIHTQKRGKEDYFNMCLLHKSTIADYYMHKAGKIQQCGKMVGEIDRTC